MRGVGGVPPAPLPAAGGTPRGVPPAVRRRFPAGGSAGAASAAPRLPGAASAAPRLPGAASAAPRLPGAASAARACRVRPRLRRACRVRPRLRRARRVRPRLRRACRVRPRLRRARRVRPRLRRARRVRPRLRRACRVRPRLRRAYRGAGVGRGRSGASPRLAHLTRAAHVGPRLRARPAGTLLRVPTPRASPAPEAAPGWGPAPEASPVTVEAVAGVGRGRSGASPRLAHCSPGCARPAWVARSSCGDSPARPRPTGRLRKAGPCASWDSWWRGVGTRRAVPAGRARNLGRRRSEGLSARAEETARSGTADRPHRPGPAGAEPPPPSRPRRGNGARSSPAGD